MSTFYFRFYVSIIIISKDLENPYEKIIGMTLYLTKCPKALLHRK